jgi:hypothetical protein
MWLFTKGYNFFNNFSHGDDQRASASPDLTSSRQSFTCQPAWANSPIEMMQNAPLGRGFMVDDGWCWLMMVDDG